MDTSPTNPAFRFPSYHLKKLEKLAYFKYFGQLRLWTDRKCLKRYKLCTEVRLWHEDQVHVGCSVAREVFSILEVTSPWSLDNWQW